MDYVPLYVAPPPPTAPADAETQSGRYALTSPPYCWLEVGTPIHLHFSSNGGSRKGPCRCLRDRSREDGLDFRGWIIGERASANGDVEYVVVNEERGARMQQAIILFRHSSGFPPLPRIAEVAVRHALPLAAAVEDEASRVDGPTGLAERVEEGRAGTNHQALTGARGTEWPHPMLLPSLGPWTPSLAAPTSQTRHEHDLRMTKPGDAVGRTRGRQLAAHPYRMWDVYGTTAAPCATRAETDGIRNYGQPIVVRARERTDGRRVPFEMGLEASDGVGGTFQYSSEPPQRNPDVWYYAPQTL